MWLLFFSNNTQHITHSQSGLVASLLSTQGKCCPARKSGVIWRSVETLPWCGCWLSEHPSKCGAVFKIYLSRLLTLGLHTQTCPSWASWLTPNATRLQSLPVFLCCPLCSASWLPFQRELFFLSNFLFVRQELPPSKETGYLVSDILIFFEEISWFL